MRDGGDKGGGDGGDVGVDLQLVNLGGSGGPRWRRRCAARARRVAVGDGGACLTHER